MSKVPPKLNVKAADKAKATAKAGSHGADPRTAPRTVSATATRTATKPAVVRQEVAAKATPAKGAAAKAGTSKAPAGRAAAGAVRLAVAPDTDVATDSDGATRPRGRPGRPPKAVAGGAVAAKKAGRRGPKPKARLDEDDAAVPGDEFETLDDDVDHDAEVIEVEEVPALTAKQRLRDKRAKEKALIKEALANAKQGITEEELEARRSRLKQLIKLGKDRGFLTYAEINDHLPEGLVEAEAIESIIGTFSDMGISVFDQAPDADTLLMADRTVTSSDDDTEEEAEAALSTVDSEFGRTTDPVRMYMREMGSVELLTREGEIVIAKKIEEASRT